MLHTRSTEWLKVRSVPTGWQEVSRDGLWVTFEDGSHDPQQPRPAPATLCPRCNQPMIGGCRRQCRSCGYTSGCSE